MQYVAKQTSSMKLRRASQVSTLVPPCHLPEEHYKHRINVFNKSKVVTRSRFVWLQGYLNIYTITALFSPRTAKTKCRKFETNIPRKGISGPQSQFPHSCVCGRIIYFHDGSAFSAGGNMWTVLGIYKPFTDTWMWKFGLRPRNSQKRNI